MFRIPDVSVLPAAAWTRAAGLLALAWQAGLAVWTAPLLSKVKVKSHSGCELNEWLMNRQIQAVPLTKNLSSLGHRSMAPCYSVSVRHADSNQ